MTSLDVIDVHSDADFDVIAAEWRELAWGFPGSSYFQSPEWVRAWWSTLAAKPPTKVAVWRDGEGTAEALVAISRVAEPLHRKVRIPMRFWTNAGSGLGAADHAGPLVPEHRSADVEAWLNDLGGSLLIRNAAPGATFVSKSGRAVHETVCPRLAIPPADESIGRSTKYRKRRRRNSRVLQERGLEFQAVDGPDITSEMVERLMAMHEARSDDRGWGSTFTSERIEFHRQLIASSDKGRGPGMMVATNGPAIVGVLYGFWWNGSFIYFQTGWDPSW
jgi:CelD/BcsL family acetyltransferase involved in cellulose biosynthesis